MFNSSARNGSALTSAEDLFPEKQMVFSPCHILYGLAEFHNLSLQDAEQTSSLVLIMTTGKSRKLNCFYTMSNVSFFLSINSISINLSVIMFSIYYFSEVE